MTDIVAGRYDVGIRFGKRIARISSRFGFRTKYATSLLRRRIFWRGIRNRKCHRIFYHTTAFGCDFQAGHSCHGSSPWRARL